VQGVDGKLGPGAVITGTVKAGNSSGPPIPMVCVTSYSSIPNTGSSTDTEFDGSYRLTGMATGKYKVAFDPGCFGVDTYQGETIPVQTKAGTTVTVNAYLQPASGRLAR
jgi:hypothetical protein